MDVIEHYLGEQPLVEIPKAFKDLLLEASTSDASDVEAAICVAYNTLAGSSNPVGDAGIKPADWAKIQNGTHGSSIVSIGNAVAKALKGGVGPKLVWSGRGSSKTHYSKGSNKTPKTDLYGDSSHRISLKKAADTGAGAQLMSAASGETAGVFEYGVKHFSAQGGSIGSGLQEVFDILQNEMAKTARSDLNIEVAKGKIDFKTWYTTHSTRKTDVEKLAKKMGITSKHRIGRHLRSELSLLGTIPALKNAKGGLLTGVPQITRKELKPHMKDYIASDMKIGNVLVSPDHLAKAEVAKELLSAPNLRKQIVDVMEVAMDTPEWKAKLTSFLQSNGDLKRWIVYEAASGLGKFTGKAAGSADYSGTETAVANKILVFNSRGVKKLHDIYTWSDSNSNLCDNISISYKGSGRRKYIKFGLAAEQVDRELSKSLLDESIEEEYVEFEKKLNKLMLNEGMWDFIQGKVKSATAAVKTTYEKIKNAVQTFYEQVIKNFIGKLKSALNKGLTYVLEALGVEMEGEASVKTPKW